MPANFGLENLAIPVTQDALDELRSLIDTPREEAFRWVSDEFDRIATEVYIELGSLKLEALSGWTIFNAMAPLLRAVHLKQFTYYPEKRRVHVQVSNNRESKLKINRDHRTSGPLFSIVLAVTRATLRETPKMQLSW
ncbi:hypothetical protein C8J57DRAFT_1238585 [Mycena rebaudengoi]|nr:hypothetical protein C8J57DRAFT_1238585 [Mycena rebaudengoi]